MSRKILAPLAFSILAASSLSALALQKKNFDAAAFAAAQKSGEPVVVMVTAPWCPTCTAQHKVIDGLSKDARFDRVTIFAVDFDNQKDALKAFNASKQSTLIGFSGMSETGRIVGETSAAPIEAVLAGTLSKAAK